MGALSTIGQISLFLAFCVVLLMIFKSIEKIVGRKTSNGHLTVQSLIDSEERIMADMRNLADARMLTMVEKVTDPIVKEIRGLRDDLSKRRRFPDSQ